MPQEWSKGKTPVKQVMSDIASVGRAVKITLRGGTYLPGPGAAARTARARQAADDYAKFDSQTKDKNTKTAAAPRGPTAAERRAALKAAKLAAKGRGRRKKFVIAKGKKVAKKRKLLLNIKEASA